MGYPYSGTFSECRFRVFFVLDLTSFGGNRRWYPRSSGTFPGCRFRLFSLFRNWFLLEVTVGGIRAVQGHFLTADSDFPLFQDWLRLEVTVGGIRAIQAHFQNADSGFFFVLDLTSSGGNCRLYQGHLLEADSGFSFSSESLSDGNCRRNPSTFGATSGCKVL